MSATATSPRDEEVVVYFDPTQRKLYETGRPSEYAPWRWPRNLLVGRDNRKNRCFPEVAVRAHFERCGYKVLLSAPKYPNQLGFLLFHFRQKRLDGDKAFKRMQEHFPGINLNALAERAGHAKMDKCGGGGGGDPDLFVFRPRSSERFFVEAKDRDRIRCNQRVCFRLIRRHLRCPVRIVRIHPQSRLPGDASPVAAPDGRG